MPRYKLRTLLILLAILPPLLWVGWGKYEAWRAERERQRAERAAIHRGLLWLRLTPGPLRIVEEEFVVPVKEPDMPQ